MRFCFISHEYAHEPPFGGVATYTRATARWLAAHGHQVHVVCPTRTQAPCCIVDEGVNLSFVPPKRIKPRRILKYLSHLPGLSFFYEAYCGWNLVEDSAGAWLAVRALGRRSQFDIIECSDFGGLSLWGVLPPKRKQPIVVRGHGYLDLELPITDFPGRYFHHGLERYCLQRADFVLTNSRFLANIYTERFGVKPERISTLYYGYQVPDDSSGSAGIRCDQKWGPNDVVLIYVGRLNYRKGTDILIKALEIARAQCPSLRTVFLGKVSDQFVDRCEAFFLRAGDWAVHVGPVDSDSVWCYLADSDILALPSRSEPLGRVLVEAQLLGLPVIGTHVGGIPEAVVEGQTGILVEPGDASELADAIIALCSHSHLREEMGSRARATAQNRFAMDFVMEQQMAVYDALANGQLPVAVS